MSWTETASRPAQPFRRGQLLLVGALLALAAIGWIVVDHKMRGMDAGPGTDPGTLSFYIVAWVVMMGAMMFPSIAPMVLSYARIVRGRRERSGADIAAGTPLFVTGYLASWTAFGLLAYGLFVGVRALSIHFLRWDDGGAYVAGGVIVAAALYQLTPAKDVCLRHCRSPFAFLTDEWRDGPGGAFVMGAIHGAWCVGCCWGLMAALFAVGVMSVGWMVFVAVLIAVEKLSPWPAITRHTVAAVLVALGIGVAFFPKHVPGLTLPNSAAARGAMSRMHMAPSPMPMHSMHKSMAPKMAQPKAHKPMSGGSGMGSMKP